MPPRAVTMARSAAHALDVSRAGRDTNENHVLALLGQRKGFRRVEYDLAHGGAGAGRQAGYDHVAVRILGNGRVQQLVEL